MTNDDLISAIALALHKEAWGDGAPPTEHEMTEMTALARAALMAIKEAGIVIVPREPNDAMIKAGVHYRLATTITGDNTWPDDTARLYAVMIAASPMEDGK